MTCKHNGPKDLERRPDPDVSDGPDSTERAEDRRLAELLSAAWDPPELSQQTQDRLLSLALDNPLAPPTNLEQTQAARLRRALEGGPTNRDAALARALALAAKGEGCDIERATMRAARIAGVPSRRRTNVIYVAFGFVGLAMAAAATVTLSLFPLGRPERVVASGAPQVLVSSHSTAPLFHDKFAVGKASERVDLIVAARERELRANRYAAWGLR